MFVLFPRTRVERAWLFISFVTLDILLNWSVAPSIHFPFSISISGFSFVICFEGICHLVFFWGLQMNIDSVRLIVSNTPNDHSFHWRHYKRLDVYLWIYMAIKIYYLSFISHQTDNDCYPLCVLTKQHLKTTFPFPRIQEVRCLNNLSHCCKISKRKVMLG